MQVQLRPLYNYFCLYVPFLAMKNINMVRILKKKLLKISNNANSRVRLISLFFRVLYCLFVCLFVCLYLYSRANNIQMAVHMNRRAFDCELNKYIPPASSFLLFFLQGWLTLLLTFLSISKALISLLTTTQPSFSHQSSL